MIFVKNRPPVLLFLVAAFVCGTSGAAAAQAVRIDADFAGGNIRVDRIEGDEVYLRPDLRDTVGDWFSWCCRVRGAEGRMLTFRFDKPNRIGALGPAVSVDGGRTWRWLGKETVEGVTFRYEFGPDAKEVRFGFAFPYVAADLRAFVERHAGNAHLRVETLCRSEEGRDVELLRVGRLDGECTDRVVLTCRHHACESMASYALEGIIEETLSDTPDGRWLREHVEFFIVPFMDKDGVETGDQGKNRSPFDHNRDYVGESRYATVRTVREQVPAWSEGKLRIALDMHCPGASGAGQEQVFFCGGPNDRVWGEIGTFSETLEAVQRGPITFRRENNIPFGVSWNSAARLAGRKPFSHWGAEQPGVRLGTTIEIAYANAEGTAVTAESARLLGRDLARAMRAYLEGGAGTE